MRLYPSAGTAGHPKVNIQWQPYVRANREQWKQMEHCWWYPPIIGSQSACGVIPALHVTLTAYHGKFLSMTGYTIHRALMLGIHCSW
jgi:hypothetical protein